MRGNRLVLAGVIAATLLTTTGAGAQDLTVRAALRQTIVDRAEAAGFDPAAIMDRPVALQMWFADGTQRITSTTIGEVLSEMAPPGHVAADGDGPAGTPEIVAGNMTQAFVDAYFGSTSGARCGGITVTDSATVPQTPTVPVTAAPLYATPVPGALAPVIPVSSWALPAYSAGGPTRHIEGSYSQGLHTVGTLVGSNASTASGAPAPAPVWLPMAHVSGFVSDRSIDFVGRAAAFQAKFRLDFFGFTICVAAGGLLLSDGTTIFDNRPVQGQTVEFPDVP